MPGGELNQKKQPLAGQCAQPLFDTTYPPKWNHTWPFVFQVVTVHVIHLVIFLVRRLFRLLRIKYLFVQLKYDCHLPNQTDPVSCRFTKYENGSRFSFLIATCVVGEGETAPRERELVLCSQKNLTLLMDKAQVYVNTHTHTIYGYSITISWRVKIGEKNVWKGSIRDG